MTRTTLRASAALAGGLAALAVTLPVSAHDVHTFGKVTVALGWRDEPAYVGFANAVQLLVKDQAGNPITSITDKDLTVVVSLGSEKTDPQALVPTADPDTGLGLPGEYEYNFIPTAPGNYTFHVTGTVSGQAIDDNVTAGPSTFDEVKEASEAQWPNKIPATSDLSTQLQRDTARIADLQASATAAQSAANTTHDRANLALIIGIIALALGVLLGAAGIVIGLRARRRPTV